MERILYRDGIEERIVGDISVKVNHEGHTIESYTLADGKKRFFVTLAGTHWCAHGDTVAEAVADAIWKDPKNRPPLESLVAEIKEAGKDRVITLSEFRHLTGACLVGCHSALKKIGRDTCPMKAYDIRDIVSREWGNKLLSILGWPIDLKEKE